MFISKWGKKDIFQSVGNSLSINFHKLEFYFICCHKLKKFCVCANPNSKQSAVFCKIMAALGFLENTFLFFLIIDEVFKVMMFVI